MLVEERWLNELHELSIILLGGNGHHLGTADTDDLLELIDDCLANDDDNEGNPTF